MNTRQRILVAAAAALGVSVSACGGSPAHSEPAATSSSSGSSATTGSSGQASCGAGEGSASCGAASTMADGGMPMGSGH